MERRNIPENRPRGYEKGTALREKFYIRRERGYGAFGSTLSLPRYRLFLRRGRVGTKHESLPIHWNAALTGVWLLLRYPERYS